VRRTRSVTRLILAGAVSAGLLGTLPGCSHTVSVGSGGTLRLALSEYRVVPQSVRAARGELTLIVTNDGRLTHNLAIEHGGQVIAQTPPIPPGVSSELFISLTRGSYLMTSTLFSDQALGTYGTLTVSS
jgi:hypothetical protein